MIDDDELPPCIGERMRDGLQSIYHHGTEEGPTMTLTDHIHQLVQRAPKMLDIKAIMQKLPETTNEDAVFRACQQQVRAGRFTSLMEDGTRVYGVPEYARRSSGAVLLEPVKPVPRRQPQHGLSGVNAEMAILLAFVPGEAIAVSELVRRLDGTVTKPMVVQKLQKLRLNGKIVKHGGYSDATWSLATVAAAPKAEEVIAPPLASTEVAAAGTDPAIEPPSAAEPPTHLVLTTMVRTARALADDSLRRALQLPVPLSIAQQLQTAATALHQASEALLVNHAA
jgi:hypothetical protein